MRLDTFRREGILFSFVLTLVSACGGSAVVTQDKPTPSGPELTEAVGGGVVGAAPETSGEAAKSSETVKLVSSDIAQYFQSIDADPAEAFPIEISDFYLAEDSKITPENLEILEWNLHQEGALLSADDKLVVNGFSAKLKLKSLDACGQLSVDHLVLIFCPGSIEATKGKDATKVYPGLWDLVKAAGLDPDKLPSLSVKGVVVTAMQSEDVLSTIREVMTGNVQERQAQQAGASSGDEESAPAVAPAAVVVLSALLEQLLQAQGFSQAKSALSAAATRVETKLGGGSSGSGGTGAGVSSGLQSLSITGLTLEGTHSISGLSGLTHPGISAGLALPNNKLLFDLRTDDSTRLVVLDTQSLTAVFTNLAIAEFNLPAGAQAPGVEVWALSRVGGNKIAALMRVSYVVSGGGGEVSTNVLVTYDINLSIGELSGRHEVGQFTDTNLTQLSVYNSANNTGQIWDAWAPNMVCSATFCDIFIEVSARSYTGATSLGARVTLATGQISSPYALSITGKALSLGFAVRGPLAGQNGALEFLGNETPAGGTNTPAIIRFQMDSNGQPQNITSVPIVMPVPAAQTSQYPYFIYRYANGLAFDGKEIVTHSQRQWNTNTQQNEGVDDFTVRSIVGTLTAESPHVLAVAGTHEHASHVANPGVIRSQMFGPDGKLYTFVEGPAGTIKVKIFSVN